MDDMLNVVEAVYAPLGQREPPWAETDEFEETAAFFNKSNSFATADKSGLTAEFAWGEDQTSMMTAELGQPHPQLGKGVLVRLNLPLTLDSDDAALLAGYLNQLEIKSLTRAHLLGAWSTDKVSGSHTVVFASFIPNVMYKPGLLTQMLMTMGLRLRWVATVVEPGLEPGSVIDIVSQRYFGVR